MSGGDRHGGRLQVIDINKSLNRWRRRGLFKR